MKLILFGLLCFLTLIIVRSLQAHGQRSRMPRKGPEREAPPVAPDDIVDVPFKDIQNGGETPPKRS